TESIALVFGLSCFLGAGTASESRHKYAKNTHPGSAIQQLFLHPQLVQTLTAAPEIPTGKTLLEELSHIAPHSCQPIMQLTLATSFVLVSLLSYTSRAEYSYQDANCTKSIFQGGIPDTSAAEKASRTVCTAIDCIGGSAPQQVEYDVDYFLFRCYDCPVTVPVDEFGGCTLDKV
ncbi:hypothetical protein BUE80_DR000580, partial [Diplocarpon rosae]